MRCPDPESLDALEGAGLDERAELVRHVASCRACRMELALLRRDRQIVGGRPVARELKLPPFSNLHLPPVAAGPRVTGANGRWSAGMATLAAAVGALVLHAHAVPRRSAPVELAACIPVCVDESWSPLGLFTGEPGQTRLSCDRAPDDSELECIAPHALVCDATTL